MYYKHNIVYYYKYVYSVCGVHNLIILVNQGIVYVSTYGWIKHLYFSICHVTMSNFNKYVIGYEYDRCL